MTTVAVPETQIRGIARTDWSISASPYSWSKIHFQRESFRTWSAIPDIDNLPRACEASCNRSRTNVADHLWTFDIMHKYADDPRPLTCLSIAQLPGRRCTPCVATDYSTANDREASGSASPGKATRKAWKRSRLPQSKHEY